MVNPFEMIDGMEKYKYSKLSLIGKFWYKVSPWIYGILLVGIFLGLFIGLGVAIDHYFIK